MGIFWWYFHILLGNVYEKRTVVVDDLGDPQSASLINYGMDYPLAPCRSRTTSEGSLPGDNTAYVHQPLLLCEKYFDNTQSREGGSSDKTARARRSRKVMTNRQENKPVRAQDCPIWKLLSHGRGQAILLRLILH